jgi:hypothetical protein
MVGFCHHYVEYRLQFNLKIKLIHNLLSEFATNRSQNGHVGMSKEVGLVLSGGSRRY